MKKYLIYIFAEDEDYSLEHRLFISAVVIGLLTSIIGTIVNYFLSNSLMAMIIPSSLTVLLFLAYVKIRFTKNYQSLAFILVVVAEIAIGVLWIFNGGLDGSNEFFGFLILMLGIVSVPKKYSFLVLAFFLIIFTSVYIFEYLEPNSIVRFDSVSARWFDSLITLFFTGSFIYLLMNFMHRNYTKEHLKSIEKEKKVKQLYAKVVDLNATKDKFFQIIAHDLKNPIFNLYTVSKILKENHKEFSEEELKNYLELSEESSKNLYDLLDNLLVWAKSQQGLLPIVHEEVMIAHILKSNIDLLALQAKNKNISLFSDYKGEAAVFVDKNMVYTVIRNLISNAIKFTPSGGTVEIIVNDDYSPALLMLTVKDSGVGIPEEKLTKLFEPGRNSTTLGTNNETGTGLGLILCKDFIEKQGGIIWAESETGRGSSFKLTLPKNST